MRSGYLLAALWIGLGVCLAIVLTWGGDADRAVGLILLLLAAGYGLVPATQSFARLKQRQRASEKVHKLARDRRLPIVYLRSFREDSSAPPVPALFYVLPILHPFGAVISRLPSYEEALAAQLESVGPLVALARPGASLPELGAIRVEAPEAAWRETVGELLSHCRLVLARAGDTPNLLWELETVVQRVPPEKLVIYLQMGREPDSAVQAARYNRFRRAAANAFPQPLPELPGKAWKNRFLFFGRDWEPRFARRLTAVLKGKGIPFENPLRTLLKSILPHARAVHKDGRAGIGATSSSGLWLRRNLRWWELAGAGLLVAALLGGLYERLSSTTGTLADVATLLLFTATTGAAAGLMGRIGRLGGNGAYAAVGLLAAVAFLYLAWGSQVAGAGAIPTVDPAAIWRGPPRFVADSSTEALPAQLERWIEALVALGHVTATTWAYGLSRTELANLERREA